MSNLLSKVQEALVLAEGNNNISDIFGWSTTKVSTCQECTFKSKCFWFEQLLKVFKNEEECEIWNSKTLPKKDLHKTLIIQIDRVYWNSGNK